MHDKRGYVQGDWGPHPRGEQRRIFTSHIVGWQTWRLAPHHPPCIDKALNLPNMQPPTHHPVPMEPSPSNPHNRPGIQNTNKKATEDPPGRQDTLPKDLDLMDKPSDDLQAPVWPHGSPGPYVTEGTMDGLLTVLQRKSLEWLMSHHKSELVFHLVEISSSAQGKPFKSLRYSKLGTYINWRMNE